MRTIVHHAIQAIKAAVTGYCEIHGTNSRECGAAKEAGSLAIGVLALGALAAALRD